MQEWVGVVDPQRCTDTPGSNKRCPREGGGEGGGRRGGRGAVWQIIRNLVEEGDGQEEEEEPN